MLEAWHAATVWIQAVLAGMADPWLIAVVLALTTLLLEDLAIAAGVALATQGAVSWELSLLAVGGGIALGDLGLYGLGAAARHVPALRRRTIGARSLWVREQLVPRLFSAVMVARVVPGLRLVTYTTSGFVGVPFGRFTAWVAVAVTLWTLGLYGLSISIGQVLARHLGLSPPVAVALPIVVLALAWPLWRALRRRLNPRPKALNV